MEEKTEGGLKEEIAKLTEVVKGMEKAKEKKPKPFKIPFSARVSNSKSKHNYATILFIKENGDADFRKEKIIEQTVMVDGIPRIATGTHVLRTKGKPLIIQPSWSVEPFSPASNYEQTERDKLNSKGYKLLMNIMKTEALKQKMKLGWGVGVVFAIIIIAVIAYAFLSGGGA